MSDIVQYAKTRQEKKILAEIDDKNGLKYLCRHNGKILIAFCGYKPQLSEATIDTNINMQIQHQAMRKLNSRINKEVNPQLWTIGYATPPQVSARSGQL